MCSDLSLPIKIPKNATEALVSALFPLELPSEGTLLIVISLKSKDVIARDFSGYLALLDHIYGRLDPRGLRSYAHRKEGHLSLSEIRAGSIELILSDPLSTAERLAILFIVAKYLPVLLREIVGSYRDYEEAQLAKVRRNKIEEEMQRDKDLQTLSERDRKQLVLFVDQLLLLESQQLPSAQRFAHEQIEGIRIDISNRLIEGKDPDGHLADE